MSKSLILTLPNDGISSEPNPFSSARSLVSMRLADGKEHFLIKLGSEPVSTRKNSHAFVEGLKILTEGRCLYPPSIPALAI